jgi:hypothetical protein
MSTEITLAQVTEIMPEMVDTFEPVVTPDTVVMPESALVRYEILPPDENPAAVYLASLSPGSRRSMQTALDLVAGLLTSGRCDALSLHWGALRFQHCAAVRAALAERYALASANHRLAALRGVLKAAWNLGQMPAEEYHRAVNLPPVRGESLPAAVHCLPVNSACCSMSACKMAKPLAHAMPPC